MKYITAIIFLLTVSILPAAIASATTSIPSAAATTSPVSIQEVMKTDDIDHSRISFNLGINRRISSSPSGLTDLDISPESVLNKQLLEIYVRKLALTKPVSDMIIDEKAIELTVQSPARLLGVIPISLPYHVSAEISDGIDSIAIEDQSSWSWLATKTSPETIVANIHSRMNEKQYISITQLKAHLLAEIIETVAN